MINFSKNAVLKYYKNIVKEIKKDNQFLYGINLKNKNWEKIYALLGNHDHNYICKFNIKNLSGQVVEVNGVKVLGI